VNVKTLDTRRYEKREEKKIPGSPLAQYFIHGFSRALGKNGATHWPLNINNILVAASDWSRRRPRRLFKVQYYGADLVDPSYLKEDTLIPVDVCGHSRNGLAVNATCAFNVKGKFHINKFLIYFIFRYAEMKRFHRFRQCPEFCTES
jgi:hypothetical protein